MSVKKYRRTCCSYRKDFFVKTNETEKETSKAFKQSWKLVLLGVGAALPGVGAGNTVVWSTATAFQRITSVNDAFASDWKMPQSVIFFFDTCVWHGRHPDKERNIFYLINDPSAQKEWTIHFNHQKLPHKPRSLLRQAELVGSTGSPRARHFDWLWSGVVGRSIS